MQVECFDTLEYEPDLTILVTHHSSRMMQVECFDTPTPSPNLTPLSGGAPACFRSSIAAHSCRIILLGESGGLHCCRLMAWQETLRTLQVCCGVCVCVCVFRGGGVYVCCVCCVRVSVSVCVCNSLLLVHSRLPDASVIIQSSLSITALC